MEKNNRYVANARNATHLQRARRPAPHARNNCACQTCPETHATARARPRSSTMSHTTCAWGTRSIGIHQRVQR
eukprot:11203285-Lingulodinium_polyedra.AAC.1